MIAVHLDGKAAGDFMTGSYVTPSFVQSQWSQAANYSDGRLPNSAIIQQPGLIIS